MSPPETPQSALHRPVSPKWARALKVATNYSALVPTEPRGSKFPQPPVSASDMMPPINRRRRTAKLPEDAATQSRPPTQPGIMTPNKFPVIKAAFSSERNTWCFNGEAAGLDRLQVAMANLTNRLSADNKALASEDILGQVSVTHPTLTPTLASSLAPSFASLAPSLLRPSPSLVRPPPSPPPARDALKGNGPQRRSQKRLDRWLEEVAKVVGGGYWGNVSAPGARRASFVTRALPVDCCG